jgi:hypothetical protein
MPRETVRLELYPQRVIVSRFSLHGEKLKARRALACEIPGPEEAPWSAALATLKTILAASEFRHARAELILSNHFVHYAIVPWRDELTGDEERMAFVRHCFAKIHGARAEGWVPRLSDTRYGAPAVAAAMEPALLEAIRQTAADASLRLDSIEPFLAAAFNRSRTDMTGDTFWFVAAEKGRFCVAHIEGGQWRSLRCQRIGEEWTREMPLLLARERLLDDTNESSSRVYLYAPGLTGTGVLTVEWTLAGLKMPPEAGVAEPLEFVTAIAVEEVRP